MDAFPAFVPLKGRRVIVVGEGEMADGKAVLFEGSPAELIRKPADALALEAATYAGATLVFIASADEDFGRAAAQAARSGGAMLVNVVDRPAVCDFYTPAIVDRGAVVAAVGTTGSGPMLAGRLKAEIDKVMPARIGDLADMLKAIQGEVRARFPDFSARKAFLASVLDGPAGAAALAGDPSEGEWIARSALSVLAATPSETITIRQAQRTDAATLKAIFRDTFESTWRPNISKAAAQAWLDEDRPADYIAKRGLEFWVAEKDGAVVGLVHWHDDFVHALHVHSRHARAGVGAHLMAHAEKAIAAGFPAVRLETDTFNVRSRAFYASRGYVEADRYPDEEWGSGLTTILFVKPLNNA